jgi:RNA polymerase sigma factor for flagellar operon FliA
MTMSVAVSATRSAIEHGEPDSFKEPNAELARRNQVVLGHLPMVKSVAQWMHSTLPIQAELNDLIQAGTLGLIDAANKYDPAKGILFETYAKHRIRGAILDGLRQLDWASRGLRQRQNQIEAATCELTAELQRAPTEMEMAEKMNKSLADWREMATLANLRRVHVSSGAGRDDHDADPLPDPPSLPEAWPDWICANEQLGDTVQEVIELLPDRSRKILFLYYEGEKTMKEIGGMLGVQESRISQVHKSVLVKLAKALNVKGIHSSQVI